MSPVRRIIGVSVVIAFVVSLSIIIGVSVLSALVVAGGVVAIIPMLPK